MAFDAYLEIDGIEGESERAGHQKKIAIQSFEFGAKNPASIGPETGGGGTGHAELSTFNIARYTDKASPVLFEACCLGAHRPKAKVTVIKAGGESALPYLTFDFEKVYVESIKWGAASAAAGGKDDRPVEEITLAFGKVEITYQPQSADGSAGGAVVGSYNQIARTK